MNTMLVGKTKVKIYYTVNKSALTLMNLNNERNHCFNIPQY